MRTRPIVILAVFLLLPLGLQAQPRRYHVGLCPGPEQSYRLLAQQVRSLQLSPPFNSAASLKQAKLNEEKLKQYLNDWSTTVKAAGLQRFEVEIRCPDKQVYFWQSGNTGKPGLFNASGSAAAGRGGLNTVAKPGDNQRCFFQDTTVVLDTLPMRLSDVNRGNAFVLHMAGQDYTLPANRNKTELMIHAGLLPASARGRYLPATIQTGEETQSVTFYFLSPDDRAQLLRSLRSSVAEEPVACHDLPDRLVTYLLRSWGGKQCVSPALYLAAQRQVIRNLLRSEQIGCAP